MLLARPLARLAALAALGLSLALTAPAMGQEAAETLFKEGTTALSEGNIPLAYEKLKAAFALRPSVDIAANLALVEQKLGKKRDAAEHLAYAIKSYPPSGKPEVKQRLENELVALEADLGRVEVQCPQGTTVALDGRTLGLAPVEVQYVEPGAHTLEGKHPDQGTAKISVEVPVGQRVSIKLDLVVAPSGGPGPADAPESPKAEKPWWPYLVFAGAGAAGLGVGIGLTVAAGGKKSDADALAATIDGGCTDDGGEGACGDLADLVSSHNGLRAGSFVGFGVAGAAAVGAVVYLLLPEGGSAEEAALLPVIGPTEAGLTYRVRF